LWFNAIISVFPNKFNYSFGYRRYILVKDKLYLLIVFQQLIGGDNIIITLIITFQVFFLIMSTTSQCQRFMLFKRRIDHEVVEPSVEIKTKRAA